MDATTSHDVIAAGTTILTLLITQVFLYLKLRLNQDTNHEEIKGMVSDVQSKQCDAVQSDKSTG